MTSTNATCLLEFITSKSNDYGDNLYYFKATGRNSDRLKKEFSKLSGKLPFFETPENDIIIKVKEKFIDSPDGFTKKKSYKTYVEFTKFSINNDSNPIEGYYVSKFFDMNKQSMTVS